jgi:hypothetical protein
MLACDLIMAVRASRAISNEQIAALEKLVFSGGTLSRDQLDLFYLIDTYLQRRNPRWIELLARAAEAALASEGHTGVPATLAQAA